MFRYPPFFSAILFRSAGNAICFHRVAYHRPHGHPAPNGLRSRIKATRCAGRRCMASARRASAAVPALALIEGQPATTHQSSVNPAAVRQPAARLGRDGPSQPDCCSLGRMHSSLRASSLSFYRFLARPWLHYRRCLCRVVADFFGNVIGRSPCRRAYVCLAAAGCVRGGVRAACNRPSGPCLCS